MNIEQILEGAPERATHVETVDYSDKPETFEYLKYDGACWYEFINGEWLEDTSGRLSCYADIRNLSDLQTILDQHREIERLRASLSMVEGFLLCEGLSRKQINEIVPPKGEHE